MLEISYVFGPCNYDVGLVALFWSPGREKLKFPMKISLNRHAGRSNPTVYSINSHYLVYKITYEHTHYISYIYIHIYIYMYMWYSKRTPSHLFQTSASFFLAADPQDLAGPHRRSPGTGFVQGARLGRRTAAAEPAPRGAPPGVAWLLQWPLGARHF